MPTAFDQHADLAVSTVAVAPVPASTGTSLRLQAGDGAAFPASGPFWLACSSLGAQMTFASVKLMRVTGIAGDVLTLDRTQDRGASRNPRAGDQVMVPITAESMQAVEAAINALENAGGPTTWQATTAYTLGQQVTHTGQFYAALVAHTSGSTFDSTKWLLLGQVPPSVASGTSVSGGDTGLIWNGSAWASAKTLAAPSGMTAQDLLIGASGTTTARVAVGGLGQMLTVRSDGTVGYPTPVRVNAKAWGLVGNGTTSDTAALQAASDFIAQAGTGGQVELPPGNFKIGNIIVNGSNTTFAGPNAYDMNYSGRGCRLTLANAVNDNMFTIPFGTINVNFEGLHLEGNSTQQTGTSCGIYYKEDPSAATVQYQSSRVFRCAVKGFLTAGVWAGRWNLGIDVIGCFIGNNAGHGVALESSDSMVTQCHILSNGGDGVRLGNNNCQVTNCSSISGNLRGVAIVSGGTNAVMYSGGTNIYGHQVLGNHIDSSKQENVFLQGIGCTVTDNVINAASQATTNTSANVAVYFQLSDGTNVTDSGNKVTNNTFRNTGSAKVPTYHIVFVSYAGTTCICDIGGNWYDPTAGTIGQSTPVSDWQVGFHNIYGTVVANRLVITTPGTPTVIAGAQAGSSPPTPTLSGSRASNDSKGQLNAGTGTSPSAGAMAVLTFTKAYRTIPTTVASPSNAATAALGVPYFTTTTSGFTLSVPNAPTASQAVPTYQWDYHVIG